MSSHAPNRTVPRPAGRGGIPARSRVLGLAAVVLLRVYGRGHGQFNSDAQRADTILIVKHERRLYLLHDDYPLRTYRIALGLSPNGAKERQWDFRTPEGSYIIDFRREHSHYFKSLHISYPSPADLKRSSALHLPAGGDIFFQGEDK